MSTETFFQLARERAAERGDHPAYTYLHDGEEESARLTFAELDLRSRAVAVRLRRVAACGDRVLLLFPPGLEFVVGFLGCHYGGVVPVPTYPPRFNRPQPRLAAIAGDASPTAVLTVPSFAAKAEELCRFTPGLHPIPWLTVEGLEEPEDAELAAAWKPPPVDPERLALLQYTSGSTSAPKGVAVTHANLLHNQGAIQAAFGTRRESVIMTWLPVYHDMGLIGGVLQPLYAGARCVMASPLSFLQRPARWLEVVSRYRATVSGGPNFAYELCLEKVGEEQRAALDLASWEVAFNGSEPVRAETLDRFAEVFGDCGFRRRSFYPCYGLAESTLFVSGGDPGAGPRTARVDPAALERNEVVIAGSAVGDGPRGEGSSRPLVGCGRPRGGQRLVIVEPESGRRCPPGRVGEIWISGPSVARGYWNQPEATASGFGARLAGEPSAGPFLRTGDLGFLDGDELYVTGRLKDLIILRGQNLYPQDLELTAERAHPALRPGCGAAFSVEVGSEERLVLAHELHRRHDADLETVAGAVRRAVAEEHEANVYDVVLLRIGTLPKTSSGKVRRQSCRDRYLRGELVVLGRSTTDGGTAELPSAGEAPSRELLAALGPDERRAVLEGYLRSAAARAGRLPVKRIELGTPLTSYGLDSLSAVELQQRIESELGVVIPAAETLEGPSVAELADRVAKRWTETPAGARPEAPPEKEEVDDRLSAGERSLWFLHRLAPESGAYNLAAAARARSLVLPALRRAVEALVERHPILRTTFEPFDDEPRRRIHRRSDGALLELDAAGWSAGAVRERLHAEADRPYDLERGPLFRLVVFRRPPSEGDLLLFAAHHAVTDFWSVGILLRELGELYRPGGEGGAETLEPLAASYTDYVSWQRTMLEGDEGRRLWEYWRRRLDPPLADLDLPTDRPRPPVQSYRGGAVATRLPRELWARVRSLARDGDATPFMLLVAVYQLLLGRVTGREALQVGSFAAGRSAAWQAGIAGYFVNPIVLRVDLAGDPTFRELSARVRGLVLGAFEHQGLPFAHLAERFQPERDPSRSPLFQAAFVSLAVQRPEEAALPAFAVGAGGETLRLGELELESVELEERSAPFDLTLRAAALSDELLLSLQFNSDLFDRSTALRLLRSYGTLLDAALGEPERTVSTLPLLGTAERHQLLREWNDTGPRTGAEAGVHRLFTARAARTPESVAVVSGDGHLSYDELSRRSGLLASRLRGAGVGPEVRVGVCLERSPELMVGLLAVLESGGAYVPLDPGYPSERLAFTLEDAGVAAVLCRRALLGQLPEVAAERVLLEEVEWRGSPTGAGPGPPPATLAWVIYTSGSTGRPKGVSITHRSAAELVRWALSHYRPEDLAGVLAATSVCFDLSIFELFVPLCAGGTVQLAENALALAEMAGRERVTLINTVPSAMAELVRLEALPEGLRVVNLAGEPLRGSLVASIAAARPGVRVWNLYGPSEDTTYSTAARCSSASDAGPSGEPTIGRPLPGTRGYVVAGGTSPAPPGVVGELVLAGSGLSRGYLQRPALTAERFVPDPFGGSAGGRSYRTGDRVRWLADGRLEFLGRWDHQVKVRGFRIELAEIESVLASLETVGEAVVLVRGAARLVAWVTPRRGPAEELDVEALYGELSSRLPGFMVPSAVVALEELPRLPNGKVDRGALSKAPLPAESVAAETRPRTATEERLAELWGEVLGVERMGVGADFFRLGGHSLLATQLASRIRRVFGVELPLRRLFEKPTLAEQAAEIDSSAREGGAEIPPIVAAERGGEREEWTAPASFAQEHLWLLERFGTTGSGTARSVYVVPNAVHLHGRLDARALEEGLKAVVERHQALRTVFVPGLGERPVQRISARARLDLARVDLRRMPGSARRAELRRLTAEEIARPFDLSRGPLLRCRLFRLAEEEYRVLLTMHHIVSDGWSMGVLVRELASAYAALARGERPSLPELPIQYADFARWQHQWLAGEVLDRELDYWRKQLRGATVVELPTDEPRSSVPSSRGARRVFRISSELSRELRELARERGTTLFTVLLAGFKAFLHRETREDDVVVGSATAGRGKLETEGLIGFFINMLVLRTRVVGNPRFVDFLSRVHEVVVGALNHQHMPFDQLVERLRPARAADGTPWFQIAFGLQNAPVPRLGLPGLTVEPVELEDELSRFDLTVWSWEEDDGISVAWTWRRDLFFESTIERWQRQYGGFLERSVADPTARLQALETSIREVARQAPEAPRPSTGTEVPEPFGKRRRRRGIRIE